MDEGPVKTDSSRFISLSGDSLSNGPQHRTMNAKEWMGGAGIILILTVSLFFLFNIRSQ
jgi:hypothetical protein